MKLSFRLLSGVVLLAAMLFSVACGGGGDQGRIRVVEASPSQSSVDVLVDGSSVATNVDFGAATDYISVNNGSRHLQIEPTGSTSTVIDQNISVSSSTDYTYLLADTNPISTVSFTDDNTAATSGNFKLRVINASAAIGSVDVYIVAPSTNISTTTPAISGLGFDSASSYQSLGAGTYQIYVTTPGTTFAYINTGAISFTTGQIRTIVILSNQSGGYSVLTLSDLN
jgi:hypothetical protein